MSAGYIDRHWGGEITDVEAMVCRLIWSMRDGQENRSVAALPLAGGVRRVSNEQGVVLAPSAVSPFRIWNAGRVVLTVRVERNP